MRNSKVITLSAKDVIKQAAFTNGYAVQETVPDIMQITKKSERRTLVVAFHENGAVVSGFTRKPAAPSSKGAWNTVQLQIPRRTEALKFLRGDS